MKHELNVTKRTPESRPAAADARCLAADLQLGSMPLSKLVEFGHRVGPGYEAHDHTYSHETHCGPEGGDCGRGISVITRLDKEASEEIIIGVRPLQMGTKTQDCEEQYR